MRLLQRRHRGVADLHRQVAARHHDAVAGVHDVQQRRVRHRLGALDLGDQEGLAAGGAQQLPRHVHVGAGLRERHREVVGVDLRRGADVLDVLGRERRRGQPAALPVDALVVRQHAAVAHRGVHLARRARRSTSSTILPSSSSSTAPARDVARQFLVVQAGALARRRVRRSASRMNFCPLARA